MRAGTAIFGVTLAGCTPGEPAPSAELAELTGQLAEVNARMIELQQRLGEIERKLEVQEQDREELVDLVRSSVRVPGPTALPGPPTPDEARLEAGITCTGDRCTIERALVRELAADPSALARAARVVPVHEAGEVRGFKLYAIRPRSLGARLGLQNGDTVLSIDGERLDSAERALQIYAGLREVDRIELGLERRGEARTLTIVVE